jgi:hypothetical protein
LFQVVDFSASLFIMDNRLFMQIPGKSVSWTTFTDVFEKFFWLVIAIMVLVLSISLYLESRWTNDETEKIDFPTSTTTVLLSLIGQSIPVSNPRRLSLRILLISICVTAAVIFWGFQAGVVSVLTVEVVDYPIKTLKVSRKYLSPLNILFYLFR